MCHLSKFKSLLLLTVSNLFFPDYSMSAAINRQIERAVMKFYMCLWTWVTEREFTTCFALYKPFCDGREFYRL